MSQIVTSNLSYQIYQKGKKQAIVTNKMINEQICAQEFAKHKEHKHKMLDVLYKHYRLPLPIPSNVFVSTKKDICNLTQTSSTLYSVQLFTSAQRLPILTWVPILTLHSCCSALHKVQSLTGCRQVEIQPLRCLSIWGNIMWSREEKGHDNFMQNNWGKHPRFPPRGQSAAECLQFRWSLVQLRKCQKEKGILVRILMSR